VHFNSLQSVSDEHISTPNFHSEMYMSWSLLFNTGINILTLTYSGNSHTSANPDHCNTLRTYYKVIIW